MSGKKRTFSKELKMQVISEAEAGVPIAELNRRYELSHGMIAKWKKQLKRIPRIPSPVKDPEIPIKQRWPSLSELLDARQ